MIEMLIRRGADPRDPFPESFPSDMELCPDQWPGQDIVNPQSVYLPPHHTVTDSLLKAVWAGDYAIFQSLLTAKVDVNLGVPVFNEHLVTPI